MKQAPFSLLLFCLLPILAFSQKKKPEFEGVIKYQHKVIAKSSDYDVTYDYSALGKNSDYYYKAGNSKFVNYNAYFKGDLFKSKEQTDYLLFSQSDTVLYLDTRVPDIKIIEFNIKMSVDTILNHVCDLLTLKMKPMDQDAPISYRRYYFSKDLPIDPAHYKGSKSNAYEFIFEHTQALPLRIEFEWPNRTIVWEATEVKRQKVGDEVFQLDKTAVLKKIN